VPDFEVLDIGLQPSCCRVRVKPTLVMPIALMRPRERIPVLEDY
jgi:hypothetical protein